MPIDIVQRLRDASSQHSTFGRLAAEEHYDNLKSEAHDDLARQAQQRFEAALTEVTALLAEVERLRADNQRLRDGIAEIADRREADARVYQTTREAEQAGYHRGMATELRRLAKDRSGSDTAGVPSEEQRLRAGVREMADEFGTHAVTCNLTGNHDAGQAWEALHDRLYALLNGDVEAVAL